VYAAEGTLRAVPFDLNRLETRGTPVVALQRLETSPQGAGNFAIAADGTLAYIDASGAAAARTLALVDRQGREESLGMPAHPYFHPRLSPDGKQVAVVIDDPEQDIWVWDLARRTINQRTFDPAGDQAPVWTTDGTRLIFFSVRDGAQGLFWQSGNGKAERLGTGIPSGVTPDGKHVLLYLDAKDIVMMALDGTRRVEPLLQTPSSERNGVVSPDNKWLAYESNDSGQFEIYVRPFPNVKAEQWLMSAAGGTRPLWSPNRHELFFVAPDGALMSVGVDPRGGASGSPEKVLEGRYLTTGVRPGRTYDVSPDGQRFLVIKPPSVSQAGAPEISIVQGWFEELKRLVPVN
jgi:serine/threonine-protein kinase